MTLSTHELAGMQDTQEQYMMDTCVIQRRGVIRDSFGGMKETWTSLPPTPCGVHMTGRKEIVRGNGTLMHVTTTLRLPLDTDILETDRVVITHRFGDEIDPQLLFGVVGPPKSGPSGIVIDVEQMHVEYVR